LVSVMTCLLRAAYARSQFRQPNFRYESGSEPPLVPRASHVAFTPTIVVSASRRLCTSGLLYEPSRQLLKAHHPITKFDPTYVNMPGASEADPVIPTYVTMNEERDHREWIVVL
jgi:hypothetical protein